MGFGNFYHLRKIHAIVDSEVDIIGEDFWLLSQLMWRRLYLHIGHLPTTYWIEWYIYDLQSTSILIKIQTEKDTNLLSLNEIRLSFFTIFYCRSKHTTIELKSELMWVLTKFFRYMKSSSTNLTAFQICYKILLTEITSE
jgi:hypothetical protein